MESIPAILAVASSAFAVLLGLPYFAPAGKIRCFVHLRTGLSALRALPARKGDPVASG